jgi:hypothetical protein
MMMCGAGAIFNLKDPETEPHAFGGAGARAPKLIKK